MPARNTRRGPGQHAMLRCLIAAIIAAILLAGLVVLIVWLVNRPKPIEYTVERAGVRHFNVTPSPDAALNATFYLTLGADNPNRRLSLHYDLIEVYVLYSDEQLAVADVPPLHQPHRNETRLNVRAVARSMPVTDKAAGELKHDQSAGTVSLDVRMRARVRFKVGLVSTRHYGMQVFCSPVVVGLSPSAAAFQSVSCDVAIS